MKEVKFVAYQKGTTGSKTNPKDFSVAVERTTFCEKPDNLNHLLGSIFAALFAYVDTLKAMKCRVFAFSLPIHIRVDFQGSVIDTASMDKELIKSLKLRTGRVDFDMSTKEREEQKQKTIVGRKQYAFRVYSLTHLEVTKIKPAVLISETGEIKDAAKLLQDKVKKEKKASKKASKKQLPENTAVIEQTIAENEVVGAE